VVKVTSMSEEKRGSLFRSGVNVGELNIDSVALVRKNTLEVL